MKNRIRHLIITLALAALMVQKGFGQTPVTVSPVTEPPVSSASPVAYTWPSPTSATPYPTISLPYHGAPPACAANEDSNGHFNWGGFAGRVLLLRCHRALGAPDGGSDR